MTTLEQAFALLASGFAIFLVSIFYAVFLSEKGKSMKPAGVVSLILGLSWALVLGMIQTGGL